MPGVASTRPIGSSPEETTQDACGGDVSTNSSTDLGSAEVQAATETPQARDIRVLCIGIDPRSGRRLPHLVAIARPGGGPVVSQFECNGGSTSLDVGYALYGRLPNSCLQALSARGRAR